MKSAPDSTKLDAFIRETLKASDANLQPFDWSEVEVLLRHEQKSLPVEINKKTIIYFAAGLVALLLLFGIFKIVQHYSSLPPEPEPIQDSTQNLFNTVDAADTTRLTTIQKADTIKIDSSAVVKTQLQIDSSGLAKSKKADSNLVAAPLMPDSAWIRKIREKQDKKKKQNTPRDTAGTKKDTVAPRVIDTATAPRPAQEIKTETLPAADTSGKTTPAPKTAPKNKKGKAKKIAALPTPEQPKPEVIQPDSLK